MRALFTSNSKKLSSFREGSKPFVLALVGIFVFITLFIILMTTFWYYYVAPTTVYARSERQLESAQNFSNLVLGASHSWQAVNPAVIGDTFNYAGGSNSYQEMLIKYRRVRSDGFMPGVVIIETDLESFSTDMIESGPIRTETWYYADLATLKELSSVSGEDWIVLWIHRSIPWAGRGLRILSTPTSDIRSGWLRVNTTIDYQLAESTVFYSLARQRGALSFDSRSESAFISLITEISATNASIILVRYPYHPVFIDTAASRGWDRNNYYQHIDGLVREAKVNVTILDYYALLYDKPTSFSDLHHINELGATTVSTRLVADLRLIVSD